MRPYTGALGRPIGAKTGNYRQHSLYVGKVTCLLALFGVLGCFGKGKRQKEEGKGKRGKGGSAEAWTALFFLVSAVVFWLFSMGRFCEPVYRMVYALPFGDYLRAPVKWHHLTEFCLCVLAGYGIASLDRMVEVLADGRDKLSLAMRCALVSIVLAGAADLAAAAVCVFSAKRKFGCAVV